MNRPPPIFLSYARDDDEDFVKRLHATLTEEGFSVWWDRVSMPGRSLTFLHEIREAIDGVDRVLVIVGPAAVRSDYVRAEWQYALTAEKVVKFGRFCNFLQGQCFFYRSMSSTSCACGLCRGCSPSSPMSR
jgi:hypothetical protein